ncbi:hypothetical protein Pan241w_59890 [Gimesia alba]|uniref:Uncharacterized protein n=1 Tax=Gimesia alba TaxID=2527973 RepID=A0A517RPQ7_9PLAN|nr:hypothetical protein Pan241w_59890 [Gimesia alba]
MSGMARATVFETATRTQKRRLAPCRSHANKMTVFLMLPENEVRIDSYRLEDGGVSLHLIHIPTGINVSDDPCDTPYLKRLTSLHEILERCVRLRVSEGPSGS